jgi:hypothetical protein
MTADGFTIQHLSEFETNGRWSLVRRGLDVSCFGLNVVEIEQGYSIPEHNELERVRLHGHGLGLATRRRRRLHLRPRRLRRRTRRPSRTRTEE